MHRSAACKFLKTLGPMLRSFGSQIGPPKRNRYRWECSMDFIADRATGARKKFFGPNPVELWLDGWCLPCLQDAMESNTLKLVFVYPLFALPTKLHGHYLYPFAR